MIDLRDVHRDVNEPGAAGRVRRETFMENMKLEGFLVDTLRRLGSTPEEVANTLRSKNIKGRAGSACHCPVASYLKPIFDGYYVESYTTHASLRAGGPVGNVVAWVDHPAAVVGFIQAFDNPNGPYADLRETGRPAVQVDAP